MFFQVVTSMRIYFIYFHSEFTKTGFKFALVLVIVRGSSLEII